MYLEYSIDTGSGDQERLQAGSRSAAAGDSDIPDAPTIERELGSLIRRGINGR